MNSPNKTLKINSPAIVHQIIDGEAVVINLSKGYYYSFNQVGSLIWELIGQRLSFEAVKRKLSDLFTVNTAPVEQDLKEFLNALVQEELIVDSEDTASENQASIAMPDEKIQYNKPTFQKYTDMQDFLLVDPIHDVDEMGWPHKKDNELKPKKPTL